MVAPCQILGASVVSLDATVRVVGHARDAEARAAGNRGRAAGVREAREGHSLAVVRRVRDEWRAGRRSDVLAVVARSHASARKQTHRREGTYIPYLYGQTVTTVIIIWRAIRKRHLLSHQMALLAVSRSLSFEPARHVSQSRAGRGSSARLTERRRLAPGWWSLIAMDASPRDLSLARSIFGALGGLVLASTALALLLSQTSARFAWRSAGGGGRGVGDARPGSSARGRAVGHGHAASARQRDAPARARRARDARRRAGRVSSVFEARCGCASRRLGLSLVASEPEGRPPVLRSHRGFGTRRTART